ncbi:phosphoenolpyruvate-protein phosphotransferase PtsI [Candidatus Schneideria nysicola]|uniref:phosphoenolpyruvate-protein phosphotransferase PtsI n=1 Tax=Candidatus Schneideria nysicola TaxID=1081631 RepID=UPI001CAA4E14|nr:phosphoenolpyruvate-protein phosphotransferase PtsI [Candidatus Schneideria nysicola]UAJ64996.1 phosphoenolpyruvate-protein phosphotransferase PtsI [Candidatus Schneideria nysicola]
MISGIVASPGIVFGQALLVKVSKILINEKKITANQIPKEVDSFFRNRDKTSKQLARLINKVKKNFGSEKAAILEGHILLLEDEAFEKEILTLIKEELFSVDTAVHSVIEKQAQTLESLNDKYLKERAADIRDIGDRLLYNILDIPLVDLSLVEQPSIIVAEELTTSQTAQMNIETILGFITEKGGKTSHTSIMARSAGIPAIVGVMNATKIINNGDNLILDAVSNCIYINPDSIKTEKLRLLKNQYALEEKELDIIKTLPAITLDNHQVKICANIGNFSEIDGVKYSGAEGVGLYRTEFLFMDRDSLPSEEEQFEIYKAVAESMPTHSIIIRTMDIGGDKILPYMNLPKESNPFLGWRAIRIGLDRKDMLHSQLRAILRASSFGKLRIMYPMIILVEEVRTLKSELNLLKKQLREEKKSFDENIEVGVMIETPAAALIAHHLAKEVDFFSIGSNDLTQYTLAVDRGNELISHLYNPMSPAVLNLIKKVIDASHAEGKWTGMCGELAGDERATLLLLGMGLDEFSMSPIAIPRIKKIIRSANYKEVKYLAEKALVQPTISDILNVIQQEGC